MYAEKTKIAPELIRESIAKYHTIAAMQTDEMKDLDGIAARRGEAQISSTSR